MAKQKHVSSSPKPDIETFVKTWQASTSMGEVLESLGVDSRYASSRATTLRKKGVTLKRFKQRDAIDVKSLNELAKKSLKN